MKVGFIGAGHIGRALATGWSRPGLEDPPRLAFFDVDGERARQTAAATGGTAAASAAELVADADIVVVAVHPQYVEGVLADIGGLLGARALVSVAAGVSLARIGGALPSGARAGRVMPNVAAALGLGVFLYAPGALAESTADVAALFALGGVVIELPEEQFDAATALSGCMPGTLGAIVRAYAAAGRELGLADGIARELAVAGAHGAAAIIAREGDPEIVITAAATPGGMTAAGVAALEEHGVTAVVAAAIGAAAARARELA